MKSIKGRSKVVPGNGMWENKSLWHLWPPLFVSAVLDNLGIIKLYFFMEIYQVNVCMFYAMNVTINYQNSSNLFWSCVKKERIFGIYDMPEVRWIEIRYPQT